MSEVYWIDSGRCGVEELLNRTGARQEWVEEIHRLTPAAASAAQPAPACFDWPVTPPQDHTLLHLLSQSVISGERSLILITQGEGDAALLGGPKAVGRYNLSPKARLTARFVHTGAYLSGWLAGLAARLEPFELDPGDVAWLVGDCPEQPHDAFPHARWLENTSPVLGRMDGLVGRLEESRSPAGFLFSLPQEGPWLATLVERL